MFSVLVRAKDIEMALKHFRRNKFIRMQSENRVLLGALCDLVEIKSVIVVDCMYFLKASWRMGSG